MNIMQPIPSTENVNNPSLAGKVVLVTGGASGLGAALCRVLAEAGAAVASASTRRAAITPPPWCQVKR